MPRSYEEVRQIVQELPEDQRILLVNDLLEDASGDPQASLAEIEASWKAEVERRVAEADAGRGASVSWEEVEAPLRARLKK